MSDYAEVDGIIGAWVNATGSTLFTEWAGKPSRFFHLPGKPPHESFQIVVFPPAEGSVVVQAASVDTNDDSEFLELWEGPTGELDAMLETAVATVDRWRNRSLEEL
ncbi:MAG TPA: hypothetical protein VH331_18875 [Allosphingosinicella sp.]|jgi:hypothetical protein|nr:hypothetical protein [Allosphingosinicella sp.]